MSLSPCLCLGLLMSLTGCDKSGGSKAPGDDEGAALGYEDASSPDMAPIPLALAAGDLEGIEARGNQIWRMQRARRLGDRGFASYVGVTAAKFISLVSLDAGGTSGQVEFLRWDDKDLEDGDATADEVERWLVVSATLDPDEFLEPQEQKGKPNPEARRTIAALLVAEAEAQAEYPEARWEAYTFREQQVADGEPTGLRQTRIYLLGTDEKSPDLEYTVVDPTKRKGSPKVGDKILHLPGNGTSSLPLESPAPSPGPGTVARAVAIATVTDKAVTIVDGSGNQWEVAPKTGALSKK